MGKAGAASSISRSMERWCSKMPSMSRQIGDDCGARLVLFQRAFQHFLPGMLGLIGFVEGLKCQCACLAASIRFFFPDWFGAWLLLVDHVFLFVH